MLPTYFKVTILWLLYNQWIVCINYLINKEKLKLKKTRTMKTNIKITFVLLVLSLLSFTGCINKETPGPAGQDATVYYSEWFSPSDWLIGADEWYFDASAPDLTADIVENGTILGYATLDGDLYGSTSVRPLPAFALGSNWSYLIHEYGYIQFTCDMINKPATIGNKFRFIAIPGTVPALKSTSSVIYTKQELRNMTYQEVCKLYNIPE
jgi:hypothetical protein